MPEDNEYCACLSVILLDSLIIVDKKYYSQIFLKECKYGVKKKKIINSNNEKLNLNESDDDESEDNKSNESDED